jgi:hypothetical protein
MECRQFVAESFLKLPNTLRTWRSAPPSGAVVPVVVGQLLMFTFAWSKAKRFLRELVWPHRGDWPAQQR